MKERLSFKGDYCFEKGYRTLFCCVTFTFGKSCTTRLKDSKLHFVKSKIRENIANTEVVSVEFATGVFKEWSCWTDVDMLISDSFDLMLYTDQESLNLNLKPVYLFNL